VQSREIIIHHVQGDGVGVVLDLFREGVGQPGEAAHVHPHGQVAALGIGRGIAVHAGLPVTRRFRAPAQIGAL
jgi:hypothetical protein